MTNELSGLQLRMPFAVFDRGTSRWRTCQPSLELGNLPEQSVIWPRSGMTRSGNAFELPMWERPTAGNGASSLLKTPTAQLAVNGGSQHPEKRKSGGHGPTLADEVEHLLPTPVVTDSAGARNKTAGRSNPESQHHSGTTLTDAVTLLPTPTVGYTGTTLEEWRQRRPAGNGQRRELVGDLRLVAEEVLLPTPAANDSGNSPEVHLRKKPGREVVTSLQVIVDHGLLPTGGRIDQRSNDGNESSVDQHHDQQNSPGTETSDYHLF